MGSIIRNLGSGGKFSRRKEMAMKAVLRECRRAFLAQESLENAKKAAFGELLREHPKFRGLPEERLLLKIAALASRDGMPGLRDSDIIGMLDEELLFKVWPMASYDRHMESTGHDRAVDSLLRQLVSTNRVFSSVGIEPILHDNILEASAGTGTVIRLLHAALSPEERKRASFTHNEMSKKMQDAARRGLAHIGESCIFTNFDIRSLGSGFRTGPFGTVILSQTLHLIADKEELEREKDPSYPFGGDPDRMQHSWIKQRAIRSLFDLVQPGGTFIVIDEWPPQFSGKASSPLDSAIDMLFMNVFRPFLGKEHLYAAMDLVPGARLVADLRATINRVHSMSMLVYRKDAGARDNKTLGRKKALETGIEAFRASEPFVSRAMNERFRGQGIGPRLFLMEKAEPFRMPLGSRAPSSGNHGCVLVGNMPHGMEESRRNALYSRALGLARNGGSIIIAEEGHLPGGHPRPLFDKNESYVLYELMKFKSEREIWGGGMLTIPVSEPPGCLYMRQYWK